MQCIHPKARRELQLISDAVEAYDFKRWPRGKVQGGKG